MESFSVTDVLLLVYALGWLWEITMGRKPPAPPAVPVSPKAAE